jgi:aminoglycoside phosphotransferase family enzyme/predicted kinase
MERPVQTDLFHCMAQPSFYPDAPATVSVVDTHISRVFLTGKYAYKVKKALALPFLDFRKLEDRRRCCEAEVALNRRLAADTYIDVIPIYLDAGGATLTPRGAAVEYAVQMRQLAPEASLSHLLRHGQVDLADMERLAAHLASFHAEAENDASVTTRGAWEIIGEHCRDNFRDAAGTDAAGTRQPLSKDARFRAVAAVSEAFWQRHAKRFRRREARGRIREGHGDLRCEHVYLRPRLQIIDCIDFSPDLRCGDVAADLGFLLMDIDRHGAANLADHLLKTYAALAQDPDIYAVIDFYKCYRAMVRVKVNCLQLAAGKLGMHAAHRLERTTEELLERAYAYARRLNRPLLFVTCGLPASGKSTLARALADVFDIPVYRSDVVRKELFGLPPSESRVSAYEAGLYRPAVTTRTYARLLQEAYGRLRRGGSLILDAAYTDRRRRRGLLGLARQTHCGLVVIHCQCPRRILKERLDQRRPGAQVSDARSSHLDTLEAAFEPLDELPAEIVVPVVTDVPVAENLLTILAHTHTNPWRQRVIGSEA